MQPGSALPIMDSLTSNQAVRAAFPKSLRLTKSSEYRAVMKNCRAFHSAHFKLLREKAGADRKIGLTVSKKVGNAVVRNKVKRRIREFFRQSQSQTPDARMVLIAKPGAGSISHAEATHQLGELFTKAGRVT